jgi:hypothetical protein
MLAKVNLLGLLLSLCLLGCSGNNKNTDAVPSVQIKRFSGVVNNSSIAGMKIAAIPIGKHGQFRLNTDGELDAVTRNSDAAGRYGVVIEVKELGPYIITATSLEANDTSVPPIELAKSTCQLAAGCIVSGTTIPFGSEYPLAANLQWSAAVESISDGQFIVVNPITEMARVFGFSIYTNNRTDVAVTSGSTAAPNYYSHYGIAKGNSQTASLLGFTDILSIEPVNLFSLHQLLQGASTSLQDSIRYGALVAAWQQLELEHNNGLLADEFPFQAEVIVQFIANQGQLYQAAPLDNQILSLKQWYSTALANLIAVREYHVGLGRSIPNEVNLVITRFQQEIAGLRDGELTEAKPTIIEQLQLDYVDAVVKTKAMVEHVSDLKNNFATDEFRLSIKNSSDLVTAEVKRLAPKWDGMMQNLLSVYQYYLSCTQSTCDSQSTWHKAENIYVAVDKKLTIKQSENTELELSQGLVFDKKNPEGSTETNVHDLFLSGAFEFDGLRIEFSDFSTEGSESIRSSLSFSFSQALAELPARPALIPGGKGATEDESLIPDAIELTLPDFKLYDPSTIGKVNEFIVSGVFSALMVANTDIGDFTEGLAAIDKLGKRYSLSNVQTTIKVVGSKKGSLIDGTELRDNAVIGLQAIASEAIVSKANPSAYFPDAVYPTFEAFFNSREGYSVGSTSPRPIVVSRRGVMNFPKLNIEGELAGDNSTVEVQYLELDYAIGGLERYVVYPKIEGDDKYWGLICTAQPEVEADLVDPEYTKVVKDAEGNVVKDAEGNAVMQSLLTCQFRDKYEGESTPDAYINQVYSLNKDFVNLRELNGQGTYRISYPATTTNVDGKNVQVLDGFPMGVTAYHGVIEQAIVLGVDSLRLQFKPELVNQEVSAYLPETVLDVSLVWRTHDVIDINVLLAFDAEQKFNNPDGSGLPYLATGSDVESYSVAYRTDSAGDESGEYTMAWSGVHFVDGPVDGTKVMQRTDDVDLKEGVFAGIGSNVTYSPYSARELQQQQSNGIDGTKATEEKCGFFARGGSTQEGEDCDAIAYLTFRGLVTGSIREERDGVYVIRYIDGTWQVLGG